MTQLSIDSLLKVIHKNHISAKNKSKWSDLSLCINIIEIPDTELSLLTVSVLYNGKRRNAMPMQQFAHTMGEIENVITGLDIGDTTDFGDIGEYVCQPLVKVLDDYWYRVIQAHRMFFIPTSKAFEFTDILANKDIGIVDYTVNGIVVYFRLKLATGTIRIE